MLCVTALLFALVETQIEGQNGWASALPTWRIQNRWTRAILGPRPLTGYHFYLQLFMIAVMHAPFVMSIARLNLQSELKTLSFIILFWILEDFLYFVVNPSFGLRRFRPRFIWWHTWWWFMPRDYWLVSPCGLALYFWSGIL
jgi:hypothetical protein